MTFFKYLEPRWAAKMVERGVIRIGTLLDFRRIEALGAERGDEHEGMRITQTDGKAGSFSGSDIPDFLRDSLRIPEGVTLEFAEGAVLRQHASVPDMYVYCVCSVYSDELRGTFGGACVAITDSDEFFSAVSRRLNEPDAYGVRRGTDFTLAPCEYESRTETWPLRTLYNPVFRKPPEYAHQLEVRAVWRAPAKELSPLDLAVPEIVNYCHRTK